MREILQKMNFISDVILFKLSRSLIKPSSFENNNDKLSHKYAYLYNLKQNNFHMKKVQIYMEKDQKNNGYGLFTCERLF